MTRTQSAGGGRIFRSLPYVLVATLLFFLLAGYAIPKARELARRSGCQHALHSFDLALQAHCYPPVADYPPNLADLSPNDISAPCFICPGSDAQQVGLPDDPHAMYALTDFIYVAGLGPWAPPEMAVVICPPINHGGKGGNVVFGDHSVAWLPADEVERLIRCPWARCGTNLPPALTTNIEVIVSEALARRSKGRYSTPVPWRHVPLGMRPTYVRYRTADTNMFVVDLSQVKGMSDTGLVMLAECRDLQKLNLAGLPITGAGFAHLTNLNLLVEVDLSDTKVSDEGMASIGRLSSLRTLNLAGTRITDEAMPILGQMTNLVSLDLSGTRIGDAAMPHIAALSGLQRLALDRTGVTDAGMQQASRLHRLQILDLEKTAIGDDGVRRLSALSGMQSINLNDARVTDEGLRCLASISGLRTLLLCRTKVTDAGLKHIAHLREIEHLCLRGTSVTDSGLEPVANFRKLVLICLTHTTVTDAILDDIAKLPQLQWIDLTDTRTTAEGRQKLHLANRQLQIRPEGKR